MASIQGVYVALFGRPADPTGLSYFNGVTQNGADLSAIGDLATTDEYKTRFEGMNNAQIVTSIYHSLFNRDPEAAGLNFFVDALNNGTLNINNIAIAILDGAQGADKTIVDTKIAAADLYTAALDTPTEIAAYSGTQAADAGRAFLAPITNTVPTQSDVDNSVKAMADASNEGNTLNLAISNGTNQNIVVGPGATDMTDKNDTVTASIVDGANSNLDATESWVVGTDKIDAGFGKDTFNLSIDTNGLVVGVDEFKNVEVLKVNGSSNASAIDVANAKDLTEVWNNASSVNLDVTNIEMGTTLGATGTIAGITNFAFANDGGASDSAKLMLDGEQGGIISVSNIENMELNNSGTSLSSVAFSNARTVDITGSGSLGFGFQANTVTETVDASAFTGTLNMGVTDLNGLKTVTGSANGDTIVTNAVGLTVDQTINAGAGADLINVLNSGNSDHSITLTGGAGADKFLIEDLGNIADTTDAASIAKSMTIISDFTKADDVIDVQAFGPRGTIDAFEAASIAAQVDLKSAVEVAVTATDENPGTDAAVFVWQGDTYIYNDTDGSNTLNNGDALIKVAGVTDLTDLTAANFLI